MATGPESNSERKDAVSLARGIRLDALIAVCALLVSSLATAASWWQTRVVQQQLSAQVWPYISISSALDADTIKLSIANDGLGPAILRSASLTFEGRPEPNFIALLHAILGPNVSARRPKGERMGLDLAGLPPGGVLRAGDSITAFALTSKRFAPTFMLAASRISVRTCYCAIVPGTCWQSDSGSQDDPQPVGVCPEIKNDLLHADLGRELTAGF